MNFKGITASWEESRRLIKGGGLRLSFVITSIPGTYAVEATTPWDPFTIGRREFRWNEENSLELLWTQVHPAVLRCGVSTEMYNFIIETHHPREATTGVDSSVEGLKWLKKMEFKKDKKRALWVKKYV